MEKINKSYGRAGRITGEKKRRKEKKRGKEMERSIRKEQMSSLISDKM